MFPEVKTVNLDIGLVRTRCKVLLVDIDSQGNLTVSPEWKNNDDMTNILDERMSVVIKEINTNISKGTNA